MGVLYLGPVPRQFVGFYSRHAVHPFPHQVPISITVSEELCSTGAEAVSQALTDGLKQAHAKSGAYAQDRMKTMYEEVQPSQASSKVLTLHTHGAKSRACGSRPLALADSSPLASIMHTFLSTKFMSLCTPKACHWVTQTLCLPCRRLALGGGFPVCKTPGTRAFWCATIASRRMVACSTYFTSRPQLVICVGTYGSMGGGMCGVGSNGDTTTTLQRMSTWLHG